MQYHPSYTMHHPASPKASERMGSNKLSYSPGNWKKYITNDLRRPEESRVSYESSGIHPRLMSPTSLAANSSYYHSMETMRDEKERKKEEMLKRVREIQEKVMPLIENSSSHKIEEDISFKSKIEQKIGKLETCVDAMEKSLEIKIQKQVLEFEKAMMQKYAALEAKIMNGSFEKVNAEM